MHCKLSILSLTHNNKFWRISNIHRIILVTCSGWSLRWVFIQMVKVIKTTGLRSDQGFYLFIYLFMPIGAKIPQYRLGKLRMKLRMGGVISWKLHVCKKPCKTKRPLPAFWSVSSIGWVADSDQRGTWSLTLSTAQISLSYGN